LHLVGCTLEILLGEITIFFCESYKINKWMEGVGAAMKTRHLEADQWLNRKEWCLGSGRRRQLSQDQKDR
jgi:hypothetical protein